MSSDAEAGGTSGHRMTSTQTALVLAVLVVLTALEVGVAMLFRGPSGLVTTLLFALAIAQAAYFALVAMGLRAETRTMKKLVALPLGIAAFYSLVLIAEALWRALWRVTG